MSIIDVLSGTWRPGAYTAMGRDDVAPGAPVALRAGHDAGLRDAATWANVGARGARQSATTA
jgi:hypothetical protein